MSHRVLHHAGIDAVSYHIYLRAFSIHTGTEFSQIVMYVQYTTVPWIMHFRLHESLGRCLLRLCWGMPPRSSEKGCLESQQVAHAPLKNSVRGAEGKHISRFLRVKSSGVFAGSFPPGEEDQLHKPLRLPHLGSGTSILGLFSKRVG